MTSLAERLLEESRRLRPVEDPVLDAIRRAMLVEDVLDVRLAEHQVDVGFLTTPDALRALPPATTTAR